MRLADQDCMRILEESGAIRRGGHFVYTSGRHGAEYVNKDAVYPITSRISSLCREMAARLLEFRPEAVVGPALGGIVLSQWVAHHLSQSLGKEIPALYAEKAGEGFTLRRGYDALARGKRVALVEDILTTGGSIRKAIECVRAAGGEPVAVGALCDRGGVGPDGIGLPLRSLVALRLESWEAAACPLCARGVAIDPGLGKRS